MTKIAMIITSTAGPGKRAELFDLYLEHLAPRAAENPGQELVVWCADQQNSDVFHLFEIYTDGETMGANAQAPWFADYMAQAMPLLAGEPSVSMAEPRWSTGTGSTGEV